MGQFWDGSGNPAWQNLAARLEEQTRSFWTIDPISHNSSSTMTTEEMLHSSVERIVEVTGARSGGIYVPQENGVWLLAVKHNVDATAKDNRSTLGPDNPALKYILEANGPVTHSERLSEPSHYISADAKAAGSQSWAAVPIAVLDMVWGIMAVSSQEYDKFSQVHLELLRVTGQLLGLSLSNTVMHEQALRQASTQYRRQVAEMDTVLGSMFDGLIICDNDGVIVRANRAAGRILERSSSTLVGSSVLTEEWSNTPPSDEGTQPESSCSLRDVIYNGEVCRNYVLGWQARGRSRMLSLTASPIRRSEGRQAGTVILVRDVTDEQNAEQMKEEFLSLLSHELRGPLTVISGYAQMLTRRLKRLELHEEVNYTSLIKENAVRMSGMVGDLVDSGRLESGEQAILKQPTDLASLVLNVAARIGTEQSHAPNFHSIEVYAEPDLPHVKIDTRRIDQVLTNLITNSIKYSPEGGPIDVRVERTPPDKHYSLPGYEHITRDLAPTSVLVAVSDRGAGVPAEERKLIFERAYRGEKGKTISAQGLGLGLYISRLAVEAHGGHIGVEDGPGGVGSLFWFTIPLE